MQFECIFFVFWIDNFLREFWEGCSTKFFKKKVAGGGDEGRCLSVQYEIVLMFWALRRTIDRENNAFIYL